MQHSRGETSHDYYLKNSGRPEWCRPLDAHSTPMGMEDFAEEERKLSIMGETIHSQLGQAREELKNFNNIKHEPTSRRGASNLGNIKRDLELKVEAYEYLVEARRLLEEGDIDAAKEKAARGLEILSDLRRRATLKGMASEQSERLLATLERLSER